MSSSTSRPLSPHLTIWRWGPHMAVSILHRITGVGLSLGGGALLMWWLWAASAGRGPYDYFQSWANHWVGTIVLVALTWAFLQKTFGGLRHLVLDTGSGYELQTNKFWSTVCLTLPIVLTAAFWAYIIWGSRA